MNTIRMLPISAGAMIALMGSTARAVAIYGAPPYDPSFNSGYTYGILRYTPGKTAGNGVGVGAVEAHLPNVNFDLGLRATRWDSSGAAVVLEHLGTRDDGFTFSVASAINAAGTAVGESHKYVLDVETASAVYVGYRAVRWEASGINATELGHLGTGSNDYTESFAFAINNAGLAVGSAWKYESGVYLGQRAVRWNPSGTAATELGHIGTEIGGFTISAAYAVNSSGTAVGVARKLDLGQRAVRWDAGGTEATELEHLGALDTGHTDSVAHAINDSGTAVGYATKFESNNFVGFRAVRWDASGTAATELGNLGADIAGLAESIPYAINAAGTVVGDSVKYESGVNRGNRAVRWDASGTEPFELDILGTDNEGNAYSTASDINDAGIIVGTVREHDNAGNVMGLRAVSWGADGALLVLNTLLDPDSGWMNLSTAVSISNTNWVTGIGTFDPDGAGPVQAYERMFLMQIPEPASVAILTIFAAGLVRRRRSQLTFS